MTPAAAPSLYGKAQSASLEGAYKSPEEYASQGNERVVRDLSFSYLVETKDAAGNTGLQPIDVPRNSKVTLEQIGLAGLEMGERHHSFYTTEELALIKKGVQPGHVASNDPSAMGEYELVDWLKTGNDGKSLTIDQVLEAVGDDKDFAHRVLQAENIGTEGEPRDGLEKGLTRIIEG